MNKFLVVKSSLYKSKCYSKKKKKKKQSLVWNKE